MAVNKTIIEKLDAIPMPELFKYYGIEWEEGRNFRCPFPAHMASGKTPSFRYYPNTNSTGCFGCRKGGGPIQFVMNMEGITFIQACDKLMSLYGLEKIPEFSYQKRLDRNNERQQNKDDKIKYEMLSSILANVSDRNSQLLFSILFILLHQMDVDSFVKLIFESSDVRFEQFLNVHVPEEIRNQLNLSISVLKELLKGTPNQFEFDRQFDPKQAKSGLFRNDGLQWDSMNGRYVFPILLPGGLPVGFSGRALNGEFVKYQTELWYGFTKKDLMYGLDVAIPYIKQMGFVIIVEGILDCLRVRQAGFNNVVSPCSANLTEQHAILLKSLTNNFALLHDNDYGGDQEANVSGKVLDKLNLIWKRVYLPPEQDPDSYGKSDLNGLHQLLSSVQF